MKLTLFVNHACNLRCTYCYTGEKFNRRMSLEVARKAVDFGFQQARLPAMQISFFGGEPMLELDFLEQVATFATERATERKARVLFAVATNGTLLDEPRLELLKRHKFHVQVSLDGGVAAQDATRPFKNGSSSFAKISDNLRTLIAEGFNPRVVAVVDPANVEFLADSYESIRALGVRQLQFSPNYTGDWDEAACERFEKALQELGDRFIADFRDHKDMRLDPLNGKIVTHLARGYQKNDLCKFGQEELAISPRGRIYPCDRLVCEDADDSDVCIGDLDSGLDVARRDALVAGKNAPDDECERCELRPRCMHWCGCANYETTGRVDRTAPVVCWFERCFIAEGDRVANILYGERNATFLRRFYVPEAKLPPPRETTS